MTRFLEEGLDDGAAAVAVTTRSNWVGLAEALGDRAKSVSFMDRDRFYVRPVGAIANHEATLRHHLTGGAPSVRVIGEVQFGPTPAEWEEWTAYEAMVNRAFEHYPVWIMCPYDARVLPDSVLEDAWRTHPHVNGEQRDGAEYDHGTPGFLRQLTPEYTPLPDLNLIPPAHDAVAFREALAAELTAANVREAKALDMLVAANEVFGNALQHGRAIGAVRAGLVHGRFVLEISDLGEGLDDPLAGYLPPKPDEGRGAGLWVARQLVSKLEVLTCPHGTTVRLWL
jgi:anti-sigma regulatory factor (Ser/Thr protein kinase)